MKKGGEKGTKVCFAHFRDIKSRQHSFCSAREQAADYENIEELKKYLLENQYKYIKIFSSWGLNGWVLAKSVLWKELY